MAEKDLQLITKARELALYTRKATKPRTNDADIRDTCAVMKKIAQMDDLNQIRNACNETVRVLSKAREGFSKSEFRDYGQEMRNLTSNIIRGIFAANNAMTMGEADKRLERIDGILADCGLLMELIKICLELKIVSAKTADTWMGKALDVKRIAASWRSGSGKRAQEKRAQDRKEVASMTALELLRAIKQNTRAGD